MGDVQSPTAITEDAAWEAYTFGRDLLVAVRATLETAEDVRNLFGNTPADAVVEKAAQAYSLVQSRGSAVDKLVDATGWVDDPALSGGVLDLEDVPTLCFAAHDLKKATDDATKWLRSVLLSGDVHEGSRDAVASRAIAMCGFAWSLGSALELLGSFRPVEDRIVQSRIVSYATNATGERLQTPIGGESGPSDCSNEPEKPAEIVDRPTRAAFVLELRSTPNPVPWSRMTAAVSEAGYKTAAKSTLQAEMRRYCEDTGQAEPRGKAGRPSCRYSASK